MQAAIKVPCALGVVLATSASVVHADFIPVNPRAAYLRVNGDPGAIDATPISLANLGVEVGQSIRLRRIGDWVGAFGGPDQLKSLSAVFSAGPTLLAGGVLNRVPGAIDAGPDFVTAPTAVGGLTTDIGQDFAIQANQTGPDFICVVVPAGATHLFVAAPAIYYSDQSDPDGDFGVQIEVVVPCLGDIDCSGFVDAADLAAMLGAWGETSSASDLDGSGLVSASDIAILLGEWGVCD